MADELGLKNHLTVTRFSFLFTISPSVCLGTLSVPGQLFNTGCIYLHSTYKQRLSVKLSVCLEGHREEEGFGFGWRPSPESEPGEGLHTVSFRS